MKKWLSLFLAALMLLSLTACGGAEKESGGASGAPKTPGEAAPGDSAQNLHEVTEPVEIDFWHNYSNEKRAQWIDSVAAEFNASQDMAVIPPLRSRWPGPWQHTAVCRPLPPLTLPGY